MAEESATFRDYCDEWWDGETSPAEAFDKWQELQRIHVDVLRVFGRARFNILREAGQDE